VGSHRDHLRRAYEVGRLPTVAACPFIATPVDLIDVSDTYLVSKFAETTLDKELKR
jgi:hypothetical protein